MQMTSVSVFRLRELSKMILQREVIIGLGELASRILYMAEISVIQGLNWAACLVNIHAEDATRGAATIVTERLEDS